MNRLLNFDSWQYVREAYGRPMIIAIIASLGLFIHSFVAKESIIDSLISIIICVVLTVILIYAIGLKQDERATLKRVIFKRIKSF